MDSKRLLKILIIVFTFIFLFTINAFSLSNSSNIPPLREKIKDVIIVGDDVDYPPFSFMDDEGYATGFNLSL